MGVVYYRRSVRRPLDGCCVRLPIRTPGVAGACETSIHHLQPIAAPIYEAVPSLIQATNASLENTQWLQ